jgi:alpha-tubulin suppressor-like RCC1 family protein
MKHAVVFFLLSLFLIGCSGSASDPEEVEIPDQEVIDDVGDEDEAGDEIIYTQAPQLASINRTLLFSGVEVAVSGSYFEDATVSLNSTIIETTEQNDNIVTIIAPDLEAGNYVLELRNDYGSIDIDVQYSDYILATSVAAGRDHACAVTKDSTVLCWGENEYGQLGDGTQNSSTTPVAVTGLTDVISVALGTSHSCALKSDKSVACWGNNTYGKLGNGADLSDDINDDSTVPVAVTGLTDATFISSSTSHTCAIKEDTSVVCWGHGGSGRLGGDTSTSTSLPTAVVDLVGAVQVSAGGLSTCAVKLDGTIMCWGSNSNGVLGDGSTSLYSLVPVEVAGLNNAVSVATGGSHTCALKDDQTVACWGANYYGQLGEGSDITDLPTPATVTGIDNATAISAGYRHSCASLGDDTVKCWGGNGYDQLGSAESINQSNVPVDVANFSGVLSVSSGTYFNCALLENERVSCWGENSVGQYGDGTLADNTLPSSVKGIENAVAISASNYNSCAINADGTVGCWGDNDGGQLLDGTTNYAKAALILPSIDSVTQIDMGGYNTDIHGCAVTENQTVMCWGSNRNGQLGNGTTESSAVPVMVSGITNAIDVSIGINASFACALKDDQSVACWGRNYNGALGDGTQSDSVTPVTVSNLDDAVAITTGFFFGCALKADGTVACWGSGSSGELGNGTLSASLQPTLVSNLENVVNISAGTEHVCAVHTDKTVSCWGRNIRGQINGSEEVRIPTPVLIDGLNDVTGIDMGNEHSCAVLEDKTVSCWGRNNYGQLGDGTTVDRSTPSPVLNLNNVVEVSGGKGHACALYEKGTMACWGRNHQGQLGLGNPLPTYVLQAPAGSI